MPGRLDAKKVYAQTKEIAEAMGSPSDLRVMPVGKDGLSHLLYLNSLVADETIAWVTDHFTTLGTLPVADPELPVRGRVYPLADPGAAVEMILAGNFVLVNDGMMAVEAHGWVKREPQEPETERLIRGPREGLTETLEDNIGLVRRWIRDPNLRVEELRVGRRTKTRIALLYLADVAQPRLVEEVRRRITALDLDGVIESGYVQQLISDRRASILPLIQATERSDRMAAGILEGRVAVFVDKSATALLVPVTINELYQTPEDYYLSFWVGSFLRLIRLLGNNLAVALPGLYIAVTNFHPELLPTRLALAIAGTRIRVPVPLVAEVFICEIAVEVFREAGLRLPGAVGQNLGVVAGVVLGLTAVEAGFVSPATLVVVAVTAIASFTGPNYEVGVSWRLLKFTLMIAAALFGLHGLTIAGILVLTHAADLKSFGVSYLAPWAPLQWEELGDAPVRKPFWARWRRLETYRPRNPLRTGGTKRKDDEEDA
ncbi:MAG: spore germination protein [Firmicutes bacterium]|nr:spore germination protein [Bacillota bacterium]